MKCSASTRAASLAVSLLLGCGGDRAPSDPCAARIGAIASHLALAAEHADPIGAPPEVPLPRAAGGVPLGGAPPLVVVGAEEVRLGARGVGSVSDAQAAERLATDLRALREVSIEDDDGGPWTVALWVDPSLEVERLAALLGPASAHARFALLARATDVRLPRGERPPEWVRPLLRAGALASPSDRRERIDVAWERATAACEAARAHLPIPPELAPSGPAMGAPSIDPLVEALEGCGCAHADLAAIEAVALAALVSPEGPLVRMPPALRFGHATDGAEELALDADASVEALVAALSSRGGSGGAIWIVAR